MIRHFHSGPLCWSLLEQFKNQFALASLPSSQVDLPGSLFTHRLKPGHDPVWSEGPCAPDGLLVTSPSKVVYVRFGAIRSKAICAQVPGEHRYHGAGTGESLPGRGAIACSVL